MTGFVKKIFKEKGFGFIRSSDQKREFFFHESSLKNIKLESLEEGREVTFEDVDGAKGPRAEDIYV